MKSYLIFGACAAVAAVGIGWWLCTRKRLLQFPEYMHAVDYPHMHDAWTGICGAIVEEHTSSKGKFVLRVYFYDDNGFAEECRIDVHESFLSGYRVIIPYPKFTLSHPVETLSAMQRLIARLMDMYAAETAHMAQLRHYGIFPGADRLSDAVEMGPWN